MFTLILRVFSEDQMNKGEFYSSKNFYKEILDHFPSVSSLALNQISKGILIFAKPIDYHKKAMGITVTSVNVNNDFISIKFSLDCELDYITDDIRKKLYKKLNDEHILKDIKFLPTLCLLNEEQSEFVFQQKSKENKTLLEEIKKYELSNDWKKIYDKFKPITKLQENPSLWNDSDILSTLGFAVGKLAETTEIPRAIFKDEKQKKEFLKNQFIYRNETEVIRKRVAELNPNNATSWSNLAYLYYQNSIELGSPKGRRDGNILDEIEKAVESFDKALSLDEKRITDLYRKGRLLAEKKPNIILFGRQKKDLDFQEKNKLANESKNEGINSLKLAIKYWEELDSNQQKQNDNKNRTRSSYVKSLYNLGNAYYELVSSDWDESIFLLGLKKDIHPNDSVGYIPQDLENIKKSIECFEKCCISDSKISAIPQKQIIEYASLDGNIEAVNKLYSLGKVYFTKYWILSGYGQKDTNDNGLIRNESKNYYEKALLQNWPPQKSRQKKDFIAERLARLFISAGEYQNAIEIIINHCGDDLQYISAFVLNTLSLAYSLNKQYSKAQDVLRVSAVSKSNIALWQTHFIAGCTFLMEEKLVEAKVYFEKADSEAKRIGKQTVDSFLIAQAFIQFKKEDKAKAVEYLKNAYELNPYRISVIKKLQLWQKK